MIEIPTQNDQFSKMMLLSAGVLTLVLSVTYFFTKNLEPAYAVIGLVTGLIIIISGYLFSPRGWIKIRNNSLYIFNERESLNLAQLKEVVLKNDTITFVDILGVNRNSTLLRLDNSAATKIKTFLQDRLQNDHISIIDCVTETAPPRKV
ncbi:MAG: hypothetical protein JST32_00945 [Bacteroidetes bacterium]|nr:hypothetical protein [Bacteroidota bacterium]